MELDKIQYRTIDFSTE